MLQVLQAAGGAKTLLL